MKYFLSLLIGLALGIATASAALFYNPLTLGKAGDTKGELVFNYSFAPSAALLAIHDNTLSLPVVPVDAPLLWEGGLKGSYLAVLPLDTDAGNGAVATRLTIPSETELLKTGVIAQDYWLVSVPDAGSLFVEATSNYWPLLRDTAVRIDLFRREWTGPQTFEPTRGPVDGAAKVIGLTGHYTAGTGRGTDRLALESYDGSLAGLTGRLTIALDPGETPN